MLNNLHYNFTYHLYELSFSDVPWCNIDKLYSSMLRIRTVCEQETGRHSVQMETDGL